MFVTVQQAIADIEEYKIPSSGDFRRWAKVVSTDDVEVCVRIVDKEESARLNYKFRKQAYPTNVLSFPFESPIEIEKIYLGDIVITASVIVDESYNQKKPIESHWAHIFIHGLLHLQGYDHQNEEEAKYMELRETEVLHQMGFPDPYAENASSL